MSEINLELLHDFIDESREHLDEMESLLLQLGDDLGNLELLNDIFRTMHNVKGASQLTGLDKISRLSHRLEDLLDLLRDGQMQATSEIVDLLIAGRDRIVTLVSELEESQQELSAVDELVEQLSVVINGDDAEVGVDAQVTEQAESAATQTAEPVASSPALSDSNVHDEENDDELFNIYLEHLKEQFSLLSIASSYLKQVSVDVEHLLDCKDAVSRLKSSANYMGYDDIVSSFDAWDDTFDNAYQMVSRGEATSIDFIDKIAEDLIDAFPQLLDIWGSGSDQITDTTSTPTTEVQDDITESTSESDDDISAEVLAAFKEQGFEEASDTINVAMVDVFIDDSREHLDEMESLLLELLKDVSNIAILASIFRTVHNLKVASQLAGLERISTLAHRMEDLLSLLRAENIATDSSAVELLISGRDRIVHLITELEISQQEQSPIDDLIEQLTALIEFGHAQQINVDLTNPEPTASAVATEQSTAELKLSSAITISASYFEEGHDQELFNIFSSHLQEQLTCIRSCVVQLKETTEQLELFEECTDAISCLQSSSNYMGYDELTRFYEEWKVGVEDAIDATSQAQPMSLDFMDEYIDNLSRLLPQIESHTTTSVATKSAQIPMPPVDKTPADSTKVESVPAAVSNTTESSNSYTSQENELVSRLSNALELSVNKMSRNEHETLDEVFDELVTPKMGGGSEATSKSTAAKKSISSQQQQKTEPSKASQRKAAESGEKKLRKSVRVDADKIDALMNQVGELVVDRSYFFQLFNEMRELQQYLKETSGLDQKDVKKVRTFTYRLGEAISALGRTSNELQEGVMKMRMLPVAHLFNRYPRLVHDLTSRLDKKVELILRGEDTELDKMIVEELSDPLIHIIRNAIDHGIESTEERANNNKSETGKLVLEAYQESNHIVIEVTDDGRGLDPVKIKQKAISKELYTHEELERFTDREVSNLILMPGFSTAEKITDTSGRGVGMDVVKRNIEKLNGTLDIDSRVGKGTQMRLKIPLTLAIIHALMVRVGDDMLTIPLANVDETVRITKEETSLVEGVEVIHLRGIALPIFRLSSLFSVSADKDVKQSFVVIINSDGQRIGFVVDELLGQEEVVIKPLEDYVQEKSGFSGATVVGDGRISLILDVYELVKMTANRQIKRHKKQAESLKMSNLNMDKKPDEMNDRLH